MNGTAINSISSDLGKIKESDDPDTGLDLSFVLETLTPYNENDLLLFRDCIDFTLIYRKN